MDDKITKPRERRGERRYALKKVKKTLKRVLTSLLDCDIMARSL